MTPPPKDSGLARLRDALMRVVRGLPWRSPVLWLIVVVNITVLGLYIWSRDGQQITVRVEAIGTQYSIDVDGRTVATGDFPKREPGGVGFRLKANGRIDTIAGPIGIDSLKVTDATTGDVLFEDDLSGSIDDRWRVGSPRESWEIDRGVLTTSTGGLISVAGPEWRDYYVDAKLRNVEDVTMFVWLKDTGSTLQADLSFFRSYRTVIQQWANNEPVSSGSGKQIQLDEQQSIRSITAIMLRPYPTVLLLALITGAIAFAAGWMRVSAVEERLRGAGGLIAESSEQLMIAICVFAFALLWYILYFVSDDMPHVPDSVLYVFQSKIFASFHLTAPAPPGSYPDVTSEAFSIFHPHMDQVADGRWFSHYPFGHPMFLALGQLVRVPSLVPPLLGAGSVALIYVIGRRIFGTPTGLLAAALLVVSPFFQMTASNYMSHNTAAFVILACLALYTWQLPLRWPAMLGAGLCFGLLFNIRPLPAVAFMVPLAGLMAYDFVRAKTPLRSRVIEYAAFAGGALIMFGLYLLYNKATTGSFAESGYAEQGTFSDDTFGFAGTHTVAFGLQNQRQLLALMQLVADGWPAFVGFGIAMLPFLLGSRHRWDYFLGACFLSLAGMNIFYRNAAVMNGPRFWYESLPFLMLLTARGAFLLRDAAASAASWLHERIGRDVAPSRAFAGAWVLAVVATLMAYSASAWMLQTRQAWAGLSFTPAKISELENFNFSDDRLLNIAEDMDINDALIFVKKCQGWWCYGSEFWTNSPTLDGDIVWAEQQGTSLDITILDAFEGRTLYLADYDARTIVPVTRQDIVNSSYGARPGPGGTR
jgi:hypothetical protein